MKKKRKLNIDIVPKLAIEIENYQVIIILRFEVFKSNMFQNESQWDIVICFLCFFFEEKLNSNQNLA
jgi:hypothetical protein